MRSKCCASCTSVSYKWCDNQSTTCLAHAVRLKATNCKNGRSRSCGLGSRTFFLFRPTDAPLFVRADRTATTKPSSPRARCALSTRTSPHPHTHRVRGLCLDSKAHPCARPKVLGHTGCIGVRALPSGHEEFFSGEHVKRCVRSRDVLARVRPRGGGACRVPPRGLSGGAFLSQLW